MKAIKLIALALAGLILPASLAMAIYLVSAGSFDAPAGAVPRVSRIAQPRPTTSPSPTASPRPTDGEDISGPCDEAEHADDPLCTGAGADDNSGSGSDNSGSGSDNSGSGSDNSGSGSDNSGPGSDSSGSGSDNSGPGSDSSGSGSGDSGGDD